MTKRLLTADEVAELICMTKEWVYAQVRANRIPHIRLGRRVRFRRESIDTWLREVECGRIDVSDKCPRAAGTAGGVAHEEATS